MTAVTSVTKAPLVAATLLAVSVLPIMQVSLLSPSLSAIRDALGSPTGATLDVRLMLIAPTIVVVICSPIVGFLADRTGGKGLLALGLAIYGLCAIAAFLADSMIQLIAARLALGVGLAIISTMTATFVGSYFEGPDRQRILGWQAALAGLGGAVFPIVGGFLAAIEWRYAFVPCLLALLLIPAAIVLRQPAAAARSDQSLPESLLRAVLLIYAVGAASAVMLYLVPLQLAFHLRELGTTSPATTGLALAISALTAAAISMIYRPIQERLGYPLTAAFTLLTMAIGYALIGSASQYGLVLGAGLVAAGLGFGLIIPNATAWLLSIVPASARGRASGGLATAFFLGQAISPFVFAPMVFGLGSRGAFFAVSVVGLVLASGLIAYGTTPRADR